MFSFTNHHHAFRFRLILKKCVFLNILKTIFSYSQCSMDLNYLEKIIYYWIGTTQPTLGYYAIHTDKTTIIISR